METLLSNRSLFGMAANNADSRPSVASALGTALMDLWSSWSAHFPVTEKVAGSSPVRFAFYLLSDNESNGGVAQLVERLDGIQRVAGSNPVISTMCA